MNLLALVSLISTLAGIGASADEADKADKYKSDTEKYAKEQLALQNKQIAEENKRARLNALRSAIGANTPIMPLAQQAQTAGPREPNLYNDEMIKGISAGASTLANSKMFGGY